MICWGFCDARTVVYVVFVIIIDFRTQLGIASHFFQVFGWISQFKVAKLDQSWPQQVTDPIIYISLDQLLAGLVQLPRKNT